MTAHSSPPDTPRATIRALPGIVAAALVAALAMVVHHRYTAVSAHVVAVLAGIAAANLGLLRTTLKPGLQLAAKRALRAGIVLLGFRLSISEVRQLGVPVLVGVLVVVVATFAGTRWLGARMGLRHGLSLLVATGYSICGASAIAAVEPFADATEEDVAYAMALVTLCGSLSIAVLPLLGHLLGLGDARFGAWVGAAVHDVGQVVATASTHGNESIRTATLVKLARVAMLAPLLGTIAVRHRRRAPAGDHGHTARPLVVPLFIAMFLLAIVVRSSGWLGHAWLGRIRDAETLLLTMGLFALGTGVELRRLRAVGGRPLVLGLISWVLVAAVGLLAVTLAGA